MGAERHAHRAFCWGCLCPFFSPGWPIRRPLGAPARRKGGLRGLSAVLSRSRAPRLRSDSLFRTWRNRMNRPGAQPKTVFSPEWPVPSAGRHRPPGAPVGCFAGVLLALVGPPPAQGRRNLLPSQLQLSRAERPHRGFCWVCVAKCSEKSHAPRLKSDSTILLLAK